MPLIYIAMEIRSLDVARAYDIVQIMTNGGPARRTEVLWTLIGRTAYVDARKGYANAMASRVNQSMHMVILHSGKVLVIAQVDCQDNNLTSVRLGALIPIFETASGRVLAAFLTGEAMKDLLAAAGPTPDAKVAAFCADLPTVGALGNCQTPSLAIEGVQNIAAPVFDFRGRGGGDHHPVCAPPDRHFGRVAG